jgi:hypothetical protein
VATRKRRRQRIAASALLAVQSQCLCLRPNSVACVDSTYGDGTMRTISIGVVVAFVGLVGGGGCIIDATQIDSTPGRGTVEIDWSIDTGRDPSRCAQSVVDAVGRPVGSYRAACESFATSITLAAGTYAANATLVDGVGQPRTTTIAMDPFTVRRDALLQIPVAFPPSSFF